MSKIIVLMVTFMGSVYAMDGGQPPQKADMRAVQQSPGNLFSNMSDDLMTQIEGYNLTPLDQLQQQLDKARLIDIQAMVDLANSDKSFKAAPLILDLSIYGRNLTDEGLGLLIEHFPNIKELNLAGCENITDAGLTHLKGLKQLQSLNLSGCYRISKRGIAHVAGLTQLQNLSLVETEASPEALAHLKGLTQLRELTLWDTDGREDAIKELKMVLPKLKIITEEDY